MNFLVTGFIVLDFLGAGVGGALFRKPTGSKRFLCKVRVRSSLFPLLRCENRNILIWMCDDLQPSQFHLLPLYRRSLCLVRAFSADAAANSYAFCILRRKSATY